MNPHHDLAADLPPPNADEPASLRQDIVDELADHLTCAARQEALRAELDTDGDTPDEQTIADRVLARFGDPRRIARRLWFDAMKGRLMMQKLTAAFAAVAAVGAIAGCVLLWTALDATRSTLAEAIAENRKDRQSSEDANRAVLAQLAKLQTEAKKPPRSLEWNPLRVKLVLDGGSRGPAVGYTVYVTGQPYKRGEKEESISKKTDAAGLVDFGLVRPGNYSLQVYTPWNTSQRYGLLIQPGDEVEKTLLCPSMRIVETKGRFEVELPPDLAKRNCQVAFLIGGAYQISENAKWWVQGSDTQYFLATKEGKVRPIGRSFGISQMPFGLPSETAFLGQARHLNRPSVGGRNRRSSGSQSGLNWVTGKYTLNHIVLILPIERRVQPSRRGRSFPVRELTMHYVVESVSYGHQQSEGGLVVAEAPTFEPKAGVENVWKITLPPKMIASARKRLKAWDTRRVATIGSKEELDEFIKKITPTGNDFDKLSEEKKQEYVTTGIGYFFSIDRSGNSDGKLQLSEWGASQGIKQLFLNANIDLQKEMTQRQFLLHFVRIYPGPNRKRKSRK